MDPQTTEATQFGPSCLLLGVYEARPHRNKSAVNFSSVLFAGRCSVASGCATDPGTVGTWSGWRSVDHSSASFAMAAASSFSSLGGATVVSGGVSMVPGGVLALQVTLEVMRSTKGEDRGGRFGNLDELVWQMSVESSNDSSKIT